MSPFVKAIRDNFLTPREAQVAHQVVRGKTNKEMASLLSVKEKTIKFHLTNLFRKLEVKSKTALIQKFGGPNVSASQDSQRPTF